MWRHIIQGGIALIIFGLYTILLVSEKVDLSNYILVSNLASFFLVLSFIVEIRMNMLLERSHLKAFSLSHLSLTIRRISLFYKRHFLWILLIVPSLMLLFIDGYSMEYKVIIAGLSILQNFFTVYLFMSLYDLIEIHGLQKQISILPAILIIYTVFIRNHEDSRWYFANPFGGVMNIPLLGNPIFYAIPLALLAALYGLNVLYTNRHWSDH